MYLVRKRQLGRLRQLWLQGSVAVFAMSGTPLATVAQQGSLVVWG